MQRVCTGPKRQGPSTKIGCGQELPSPAKKLSPINKHSQRKNSFLHGSLTGDKPHLRAGPMLSSSQYKRNSKVFTGDFLFSFSTHIVLSGLCFFFFNLLVFSLYITASGFVFYECVCIYMYFLCSFCCLFIFILLYYCSSVLFCFLSVFLKDRMHGDEGVGR